MSTLTPGEENMGSSRSAVDKNISMGRSADESADLTADTGSLTADDEEQNGKTEE